MPAAAAQQRSTFTAPMAVLNELPPGGEVTCVFNVSFQLVSRNVACAYRHVTRL